MIARPVKAGRSVNARSAARAARLRAALKTYRKFAQTGPAVGRRWLVQIPCQLRTEGQRRVTTTESASACQEWSMPGPHTT